jgi:AcrR family transcriptional regulator
MMIARPIDRRVARTRTLLHKALISLIMRKEYDAITIDEICATADIGRSTFYGHFTGKDDLMRSGLEPLRSELAERQRDALAASGQPRRLGFSLAMFEHASEHLEHYRAVVGKRGGIVVVAAIRQILLELVRRELSEAGMKDTGVREAAVQHVVGAYLALLTWWLDGGAKQPPARIDALFRRLVLDGLDDALDRPA